MIKTLTSEKNVQKTKKLKGCGGKEKWRCYIAYNGKEALSLFRKFAKDNSIAFLDVVIPTEPKEDAFSVGKANSTMSYVPTIMIIQRGTDADKLMGLEGGTNGYMVKTLSTAEVMTQVEASLCRIPKQEGDCSGIVTVSNLFIDINNYIVIIDGKKVSLTKREAELLWLLASNPQKTFSREDLLDILWGVNCFIDARTVDTHIKRLRAKLNLYPHLGWDVKTEHRIGYRFEITEKPII